MSDKVIENNQVSVSGEIVSGFTFSHEVFGEGLFIWWIFWFAACPIRRI